MRVRRAEWVLGLVAAAAMLAGCGTAAGSGSGGTTARTAGPKATAPATRGSAPAPGGSTATPAQSGSTAPSPMWFVSLQMVSPVTGWALRWTQNPGVEDAAVLAPARTTDGGRTWTDVTPAAARPLLTPTQTAGTLFALGPDRAWFAVSRTPAHGAPRTVVFATSNGGRSWRASPAFGSLGSPHLLYFTGSGHGWLVADLGAAMGNDAVAVFATADGGMHWSLVARTPSLAGKNGGGMGGLPVGCDKAGIDFTSAATGWITGDCNAGVPLVDVTHNGGRTWTRQSLPSPPGSCSQGSQADPPQFFKATGYLMLSCYPRPSLLVSHDGGATWSQLALPAKAGVYPRVSFVDAQHGFLIPAGPQGVLGHVVYRTSDGGRQWHAVHPRGRPGPPGASQEFVTATTGFGWTPGADVTSGVPPLCRTRDGGRTWTCFVPHVVKPAHAG